MTFDTPIPHDVYNDYNAFGWRCLKFCLSSHYLYPYLPELSCHGTAFHTSISYPAQFSCFDDYPSTYRPVTVVLFFQFATEGEL